LDQDRYIFCGRTDASSSLQSIVIKKKNEKYFSDDSKAVESASRRYYTRAER